MAAAANNAGTDNNGQPQMGFTGDKIVSDLQLFRHYS
jgi:hypothetical protein